METYIRFSGEADDITELKAFLTALGKTPEVVYATPAARGWMEQIPQMIIAMMGTGAFASFITEKFKANRIHVKIFNDGAIEVDCDKKNLDQIRKFIQEYQETAASEETSQSPVR